MTAVFHPWVVEILAAIGLLALIVLVIGVVADRFDPDKSLDWAVRFECPGCDRRYEAWQGNRFFLSFEICPACGTDKKEFEATDCMREADGTWTDRAELEAVEKALRGDV